MKKTRKPVVIVGIILIAMILIFTFGKEVSFLSLIIHNQFVKPSEVKMEKIFKRDKTLLEDVSTALLNSEGDFYIIGEFASLDLSEDADRLDETTLKKVKMLINRKGYSVILKTDNEVYFQYWENLDESRGFAYCNHPESPKTIMLLVYSKSLGDNWHYCEDSFNRWKVQNAG